MWSSQQVTALDKVGSWLKTTNQPYFVLGGFAGTGKTTLAKHLASTVNGPVFFAAYTGKAAHVLSRSGCENVSTIHKLIYQPKTKSEQRVKELQAQLAEAKTENPLNEDKLQRLQKALTEEKNNLARPAFTLNTESPLFGASLLVVDEYSMVSEQMGEDLLSFGCPILFLGDPGQLPPVNAAPFIKIEPDYMLTEIHRQAEGNPIIWLSKMVREGRPLKNGEYGTSLVVPYRDIDKPQLADMILTADQLLVGRNATRVSSNNRYRQLLGRSKPIPEKGDKLVCLRNNHDLGLLNGQIWFAQSDALELGEEVTLQIYSEEIEQKIEVIAHQHYFFGNKPEWWQKKDAEEFDYGYALTVHKSQGSQWNNVVLLDEWFSSDRVKWLYTAITRAAEQITVVRM